MSSDQVRLVTVSASYGAGGSVVAPALAERLGVPFVQRATTSTGGIGGPEPCVERLVPEESEHHAGIPAARLVHQRDAGRPNAVTAASYAMWTRTCAATARTTSAAWRPRARA